MRTFKSAFRSLGARTLCFLAKFLIGWECGECAGHRNPSSPFHWADKTNDGNNGLWKSLCLCFPMKDLDGQVKEKKNVIIHPSKDVSSICCFVCPLHFAALSFRPLCVVVNWDPHGSFTTTTQAPALPMLRGTSYRKTERLTRSFSSFSFQKLLFHLLQRWRFGCQGWKNNIQKERKK